MRVRWSRSLVLAVVGFAVLSDALPARTPVPDASGSGFAVRQLAGRSGAPLRFERSGDAARLVFRRAGFVEALARFRREDARFDLRSLGNLTRAGLRAFGGVDVPDAPRIEELGNTPLHLATRAGDLNGDGRADVFDLLLDDGATIVALRGDSGEELWRIPVLATDAVPMPLDDVTGDGSDDVLLFELWADEGSGAGECAPFSGCFLAQGQTFRWVMSVRSGSDGSHVWSREIHGVVGGVSGESLLDGTAAYTGLLASTNAVIIPFTSGDHDGDGRRDLVLNELDLANPFAYGVTYTEDMTASALAATSIDATRATVLDGANGSTLATKVSAVPGLTFLAPVPDMTGDGVHDLLWDIDAFARPASTCLFPVPEPDGLCVAAETSRRAAELVDGATFSTAWTTELDGHGFLYPSGGDIDGDGLEDVVFLGFPQGGPQSSLLRGSTGEIAWSAPDVVLGAIPVPGHAPIASAVSLEFGESTLDYEMRRRSGSDGSLLSSTRHEIALPTDAFDLFVVAEFWIIPDADADGSADTLSQTTIDANEVTEHLFVERGVDGVGIFARSGVGAPYAVSFEDMNGDGTSDLLDISVVAHRHSSDLRFAGVGLPGGDTIWSSLRSVFRDSFVWLERSADLTGEGGADLLASWIQRLPDGTLESMIEPIEQRDGSVPWTIGGPLSVPPAPATGGISGSVTGGGAPFYGACVLTSAVDGSENAVTIAQADGTYALTELGDGDYRVQFADCFFDAFVPEWYDDADDEAEATTVAISGGITTDGIDADLAAR